MRRDSVAVRKGLESAIVDEVVVKCRCKGGKVCVWGLRGEEGGEEEAEGRTAL